MKDSQKKIAKKALVITTVASTIDQFCMNDIDLLQKTHIVYVAANFNSGNNTSKERVLEFKDELKRRNIIVKEINFKRNPLSNNNIFAYKELKKLIESDTFDIIHCHTPVAAMLTRVAAVKARLKGTKLIYTAHGFHFYKGAPLKNWILYYPIERWLARYTDVLITINIEDYNRAKKSFKAKKIEYIPGIGIDIMRFNQVNVNRYVKCNEIGIPEEGFILLSVGELNKNKNHETIIRALAKINNANIYYVICGQGILEGYLKTLINQLGLNRQVKLLGFRKDIAEIYKISDVFMFPSFREGLSVSLMEAIASGLPVICSDIRGNRDLVENGSEGYLFKPNDVEGYSMAIKELYKNKDNSILNQNNLETIKRFSIDNVKARVKGIYYGITGGEL